MTLHTHFCSFLDAVRREGRYRVFVDLERHADHPPYARWHSGGGAREIVVWCSNDYLGMGRNPAVINAMIETAVRVGAGAGGTRNISGNSCAVAALETELADLHRKEAALVLRKPPLFSVPAMSPMRRQLALLAGCYPIALFSPMKTITLR
jgi:5-aminolevulinate synthase